MNDDFRFRVITEQDWLDNPGQGLEVNDERRLQLAPGGSSGSYISTPLDSGIDGCTWHRVVLDAEIPKQSSIKLLFSTSNQERETGKWWGEIEFNHDTAKDALLYLKTGEREDTAPGRYIKVKIQFNRENNQTNSPCLSMVKIYYPRLTYLRYLPSLYSEGKEGRQFLERFLSLFESVLYDNEVTISRIPMYLDPMAAPGRFLPWLCQWVSLDYFQQIQVEIRGLILQAMEFYGQKGTLAGLANMVSVLTGAECGIKEYKNNLFHSWGIEFNMENQTDQVNQKLLRGVRGGGFLEKSPPGRRRQERTANTVDTSDKSLLANMGTYYDTVHYVTDTHPNARYRRQTVGIFIFLDPGQYKLKIPEWLVFRIIQPFLPVFVHAEITAVADPCDDEEYVIGNIGDTHKDIVSAWNLEAFDRVQGMYRDTPGWKLLFTWPDKSTKNKKKTKKTNNPDFRTVNSALLGKERHL